MQKAANRTPGFERGVSPLDSPEKSALWAGTLLHFIWGSKYTYLTPDDSPNKFGRNNLDLPCIYLALA